MQVTVQVHKVYPKKEVLMTILSKNYARVAQERGYSTHTTNRTRSG
jgi:hypothetical protein